MAGLVLLAAWSAAFGIPQGWDTRPAASPVTFAAADGARRLSLVELQIRKSARTLEVSYGWVRQWFVPHENLMYVLTYER